MRSPMTKPSCGIFFMLEQSFFKPTRLVICRMSEEGPASWDVPVSTATRQSLQIFWGFPSMVMSAMLTSQYPTVPVTSTQNMSDAMCSFFTAPKVTSDTSRSLSERKTEKTGFINAFPDFKSDIMLNASPCAIFGRAKPNTPSKVNAEKGWSDSSVDARKLPVEQADRRHTSSAMHWPVILPVPKVMVSRSASPPSPAAEPSQFTRLADLDFSTSYCLWLLQASSKQVAPGMIRFPLPVS
mmetsp:Transcript_119913/g.382835  ORF Transcript_119913/g.382835 Transcript_119913/m.382835 type:complete len:240 (+) Transcript_119913:666-1385(+)